MDELLGAHPTFSAAELGLRYDGEDGMIVENKAIIRDE